MDQTRVGLIIVSDRASKGLYQDQTAAALKGALPNLDPRTQFLIAAELLIADEAQEILSSCIALKPAVEIIMLAGGTGLGPRDLSPQTLAQWADYEIPGFGEWMRKKSHPDPLKTALGRGGAWVKDAKLLLLLSGSPKAAVEQLSCLGSLLYDAVLALKDQCFKHQKSPHLPPRDSGGTSLMPYQAAMQIIGDLEPFSLSQTLALSEAKGLCLAQDLHAPYPSPLFDNSAMDGFAFSHAPERDRLYRAEAESRMGEALRLAPDWACIKVSTGSPLCSLTERVVPIEDCVFEPDQSFRLQNLGSPRAFIRARASDMREGELIAPAGTYLRPEALMAFAQVGITSLSVRARPQIGIISTGDELLDPAEGTPKDGKIFNSTALYLKLALKGLGLDALSLGQVKDRPEELKARALAFFEAQEEAILLSTGAVSMGASDFVPSLARELGFEILFHKLATRPAKPVFLARRAKLYWLGLPGNPISSQVSWYYILRPLIESLVGIPAPHKFSLPLGASISKPHHLRCFYRARMLGGKVYSAGPQGSAELKANISTQAYIELPEGRDLVSAGELVDLIPLS